jgi:hypothetical protein
VVNKKDKVVSIEIGDIVRIKESWAKGIAFRVIRNDYQDVHHVEYDEESGSELHWVEEIPIQDRFACVMLGDNKIFSFYEQDLEALDEDEYCGSCGQIGCEWH